MDDKPKDSGKLKLRNTDTNRFKVDTGRLRPLPPSEQASEVGRRKAGETQQSETFVDPISLRDTSTSKLKRLDGPGAVGTTVTPASLASEKKSETVRLKVVRATPRPGTLPPSSAPLANVPLSAPAEIEKTVTPASPVEAAPKLTVPQIKLPPKTETPEVLKPGATTNIAAEYPQEPIVGDQVPPSAAKISFQKPVPTESAAAEPEPAPAAPAAPAAPTAPAAPAVAASATAAAGLSTDTASLKVPSSAKPSVDVVPTSTIKLSLKKPEGAPLPPTAASPAATPAPAAPSTATPAPPKVPSTATTGLKIRPAAGSGSTVAAPSPAADGGQTVPVAPPPAASATVKVSPAAVLPPSTGAKISLKKDPEPVAPTAEAPAAAPADSATPSSSTVAVTMPVAEDAPGGPAKKGLRLSGKASKTVSVPAPGSPAKKPDAAAPQAKEDGAPAEEAIQPGRLPVIGVSTLESVSAIAATVALAVTLFSLLMSLIKQI